MSFHHPAPLPNEPGGQNDGRARRRWVPARIPREADDPISTTDELIRVDDSHARVLIGVVDTGIAIGDQGPNDFLEGRVLFDGPGDIDESGATIYGHGSFVAGIILGQAPSVSVRIKGALDKWNGKWEDEAVATAIRQLADEGVDLINLSFSGDPGEVAAPQSIIDALETLKGRNAVVVAAGGNATPDEAGQYPRIDAGFPAAVEIDDPLIIAVGAVDDQLPRTELGAHPIADFSCRGAKVEAYANGRRVLGAAPEQGFVKWSGTSFACATITSRIAATMVADSSSARPAAEKVLALGAKTPVLFENRSYPYIESRPALRGETTG